MNVVSGFHAIEELLRSGAKGELLVSEGGGRVRRLTEIARKSGIKVKKVSHTELDRMAGADQHRGAVFLSAQADGQHIKEFPKALSDISGDAPLVVILDQVTDPHNVGAILRSADLFSVDLVVLPSRRTAHINPTVARISAGASSYVTVSAVPNLVRAIEDLKNAGYWIYGAEMEGDEIDQVNLTGPVALVMGSEGQGLTRLVKEKCDGLVKIPVNGHIDSLNVSVAAGICMYEVRRQQRVHRRVQQRAQQRE